jgi:hypothetical protein
MPWLDSTIFRVEDAGNDYQQMTCANEVVY